MAATSLALTPHVATDWMPLNIREYLEKTANLDPVSSRQYITTKIEQEIAKRQRYHQRARRAAQGRWHPGEPLAESIAQSDAQRTKRSIRNRLRGVRSWIAKAPERKEHARHAANARWDRFKHAAGSIPKEHRSATRARVDTTLKGSREGSSNYTLLSPLTPQNPGAGDAAAAVGVGNLSEVAGAGVARPQRSIWQRLGIRSKAKDDPRSEPFRAEVLDYWAGQNPDHPECPWNDSDDRALGRLLEGSPTMQLETLKKCLRNRCASEVVRSDPPRRWIADVMLYLAGPLDAFKKPLGITPAAATANVGAPAPNPVYAEAARLTDAYNQAYVEGDLEKMAALRAEMEARGLARKNT